MKDKTIRFLLVANLVAMLLILGTQMLRPVPVEAQGRVKWEYSFVESGKLSDWNQQGDKGWEYIESSETHNGGV